MSKLLSIITACALAAAPISASAAEINYSSNVVSSVSIDGGVIESSVYVNGQKVSDTQVKPTAKPEEISEPTPVPTVSPEPTATPLPESETDKLIAEADKTTLLDMLRKIIDRLSVVFAEEVSSVDKTDDTEPALTPSPEPASTPSPTDKSAN